MTELQIRALVAGFFFGIWPLLMNRSGLSGNVSAAVFGGSSLLVVLPFALYGLDTTRLAQANWWFALSAGAVGAIGIMTFNGGLAMATKATVGTFFVLMMMVQIAVPAIYQVLQDGVTGSKLLGFAFAGAAAYFLSK